jgi:hypothetical protein
MYMVLWKTCQIACVAAFTHAAGCFMQAPHQHANKLQQPASSKGIESTLDLLCSSMLPGASQNAYLACRDAVKQTHLYD